VQAAALADPPKSDAPRSKQELKKSAALEEGLKSAQVAMMGALKALHAERWMVALHGRPQDTKDFVDRAAALALSGLLEKGEAISRERVEADMASLHYMLMPGSPFVLSDEERAAAHAQLEKLEGIKKVVVRSSPGGAPFVSQPVFKALVRGLYSRRVTSALAITMRPTLPPQPRATCQQSWSQRQQRRRTKWRRLTRHCAI